MRTHTSSGHFIFFHHSRFHNNFYLDLILQQGRDITPCSRQCTCSHMLTLLLASVFVEDGFLLFTSVHESTSGFFAPTNFSNFNFWEKETGLTVWQAGLTLHREEPPPFSFLSEDQKRRLCMNHVNPLRSPQPKLQD